MKNLLESSNNPMKILDENRKLVSEIIGEENMDCIKIFKCIISSSVTPPGNHHIRTKSMQILDCSFKITANGCNSEEQSNLTKHNQNYLKSCSNVQTQIEAEYQPHCFTNKGSLHA
jgi:hypothetical protein